MSVTKGVRTRKMRRAEIVSRRWRKLNSFAHTHRILFSYLNCSENPIAHYCAREK